MDKEMEFDFKGIGPIESAALTLKPLVVIGGKNQTGKSFITRFVYAVTRGIHASRAGDTNKQIEKVLEHKIRWIFQQERIGNLVNKFLQLKEGLVEFNEGKIIISKSDVRKLAINIKKVDKLKAIRNAEYIASPLVMDIEKAIGNYRDFYKDNYGVQDIYWDVVSDIRNIGPADSVEFEKIGKDIASIIGGKFYYDSRRGFIFKKKEKDIPAFLVAFGIKLFGMLQLLIERNLIRSGSILFVEEPENHLHPDLQVRLIDIFKSMIKKGASVVITTHSPEIVRYIEVLINSGKIPRDMCNFLCMKMEGNIAMGKSGNNKEVLLEMLSELTEPYYDISLKEVLFP